MADKTYKLNISKSDGSFSDSVQFTIPQREGTYKVEFELSNGNKFNAGNITVTSVEKTYKAEFKLSDGRTIDGGTFTTPVVAAWKTVWTGSKVVNIETGTTGALKDVTGRYSAKGTIQQAIVSNEHKTRITYVLGNGSPQLIEISKVGIMLAEGDYDSVYVKVNNSSNNIDFVTTIYGDAPRQFVLYLGDTVTLTKVEQFY